MDHIRVVHRPRLLSDNGPCYVSRELAEYLETHHLAHTRGAPYHPMTQGKIERYRELCTKATFLLYSDLLYSDGNRANVRVDHDAGVRTNSRCRASAAQAQNTWILSSGESLWQK